MKFKKLALAAILTSFAVLTACGTTVPKDDDGSLPTDPTENGSVFENPGDSLGGGGVADHTPTATQSESIAAKEAAGEIAEGAPLPQDAVYITQEDFVDGAYTISSKGNYCIASAVTGKLNVKNKSVVLYLVNATLTATDSKVINCTKKDFTITLIGENTVTGVSTTDDPSNAIGCDEDVTINGSGSLKIISPKNGISATAISVKDATLDITAEKDGLHAEIDYDKATEAPTFDYTAGGFVHLDGANVKIVAADDGIQADTFVYVAGETALDVTAGGGAPRTATSATSDAADGKGIKAGPIDWGADDSELTEGDYLILFEGGTVSVSSNDDALHSDHTIEICGGTFNLSTGDDGIHADELLLISGGAVTVEKSYEGIEGAKVEISGGKIVVNASDDGINAADGTTVRMGQANNNCHLIVSGGELTVNAEGDGIDSNGSMLISGGFVFVSGPTSGANAALDADGSILVNGGYLFAVGPLGMVETPASNSAQNVVSFALNRSIAAGTVISLTDEQGEAIFSYETPKACQSVIVSCPELVNGNSYAIYGGDSSLCTFTVSSVITTVGSSGGINSPGSRPGGGFGGGFGGRW